MGTYGDKPLSRFSRRRIRRRVMWTLGIMAGGLFLLLLLLILLLRSEWFWRRTVIPRMTGDYWDTVVRWESFTPRIVPPGFMISGLELHEPNQPEDTVLRIGRLNVQTGLFTLPRRILVNDFELEDVEFRYIIDNEGDTNLRRAMKRLFEGRAPSPVGTRVPTERILPVIHAPSSITINRVLLQLENRAFEGSTTRLEYRSQSPVEVEIGIPDSPSEGRLDQLLVVRSRGMLTMQNPRFGINEVLLGGAIHLPELGDFPDSTMWVSLTATPTNLDEQAQLALNFDVPLHRVLIRPLASPIENLEVRLHHDADTAPALIFESNSFDPLTGEIDGALRIRSEVVALLRTAEAFLPPPWAEVLGRCRSQGCWGLLTDTNGQLVDAALETEFEGRGIWQYAIVDEEEKLPLLLSTTGHVEATELPLIRLDALRWWSNEQAAGNEATQIIVGDISASWTLSLDEADQSGSIGLNGAITPSSQGTAGNVYTFVLGKASNRTSPATFNPFVPQILDRVISALTEGDEDRLPHYETFPDYERMIARITHQGLPLVDLADLLSMDDAILRQDLVLTEPQWLEYLVDPAWDGLKDVGTMTFHSEIRNQGTAFPWEWFTGFHHEGFSLDNLEGVLEVTGNAHVLREGTGLVAEDLGISLHRSVDGRPLEFRVALAPDGPNGEYGPLPPATLDLETGRLTAHFHVGALRREMVEVLQRFTLFEVSREFNRPLLQRILHLTGLSPDRLDSHSTADFFIGGSLARTIEVSTQLLLTNVPFSDTAVDGSSSDPRTERTLDAAISHQLQFDRTEKMLRPADLSVSIRSQPEDQEVFDFSLQTGTDTHIPLLQAREYVERELSELEAWLDVDSVSLTEAGIWFFDQLQRLRLTMQANTGLAILEIPDIDLKPWKRAMQEAAIPIESGNLRLRMEMGLPLEEKGALVSAKGHFTARNIHFSGFDVPVPQIEGTFQLSKHPGELRLTDFVTSIQLHPESYATPVTLDISTSLPSRSVDWLLTMENPNDELLRIFERIGQGGIGATIATMRRTPGQILVESSPENARSTIVVSGYRNDLGDVTMSLHHSAGGNLFSSGSWPFRSGAQMITRLDREDGFVVQSLEGEVSSQLEPHRRARYHLEGPSRHESLEIRENCRPLELMLDVEIDRLPLLPDFLYHQFDQANADTRLVLHLPRSYIDSEQSDAAPFNEVRVNFGGIVSDDASAPLSGTLEFILTSRESDLLTADGRVQFIARDRPAGKVEFSLGAVPSQERLEGEISLLDIGRPVLRLFPDRLDAWTERDNVGLDLETKLDWSPATRAGSIQLEFQGRGFGPERRIPAFDETNAPRPLDVDLTLEARYDGMTSQLQFSRLEASAVPSLASGVPDSGLPPSSIFRVHQLAPLAWNLSRQQLKGLTEQGLNLEILIGPFSLHEYGPLLRSLAGIPLTQGTFEGEISLISLGDHALRHDFLSLRADLLDGMWDGTNLPRTRIDAQVRAIAAARTDVLRLEQLALRLAYPGDDRRPQDHLEVSGFLEERPVGSLAEVTVESEMLAIDRLLELAEDIQAELNAWPGKLGPTHQQSAGNLQFWRDNLSRIRTTVVGDLDWLSYRALEFPDTRFRLQAADGILDVNEFNSQAAGGEIALTGTLNFSDERLPWNADATITRLPLERVIAAFGGAQSASPARGWLSMEGAFEGAGFRPRELSRTLRAETTLKLEQGHVEGVLADWLTHPRDDLGLDGIAVVSENTVHFDLSTPWNPSREILFRGWIRPLMPEPGEQARFRALLDLHRMTDVGPRERTILEDGSRVPFRQPLYGISLELDGLLGKPEAPPLRRRLRSVHY